MLYDLGPESSFVWLFCYGCLFMSFGLKCVTANASNNEKYDLYLRGIALSTFKNYNILLEKRFMPYLFSLTTARIGNTADLLHLVEGNLKLLVWDYLTPRHTEVMTIFGHIPFFKLNVEIILPHKHRETFNCRWKRRQLNF